MVNNVADMRRKLKHKKVLISGIAGGIGSQLAIEFGSRGCFVLGLDKDVKAVQKLTKTLDQLGIMHDISVFNLTAPNANSEYATSVLTKYGGIDILINNAGITHIEPIITCDLDKMRDVFEVNFWSSVSLTKEFLPTLKVNKGTIIVINSVTGFSPLIGRGAYTSSKHALRGFFETLRAECQKEVDILVVYPDFIKTQLRAKFKQEKNKSHGSPKQLARRIRVAWNWKKRRLNPSFRALLISLLAKRHPNLYMRLMIHNMTNNQ